MAGLSGGVSTRLVTGLTDEFLKLLRTVRVE
jgi:hypothetical protein